MFCKVTGPIFLFFPLHNCFLRGTLYIQGTQLPSSWQAVTAAVNLSCKGAPSSHRAASHFEVPWTRSPTPGSSGSARGTHWGDCGARAGRAHPHQLVSWETLADRNKLYTFKNAVWGAFHPRFLFTGDLLQSDADIISVTQQINWWMDLSCV